MGFFKSDNASNSHSLIARDFYPELCTLTKSKKTERKSNVASKAQCETVKSCQFLPKKRVFRDAAA
jgi:hypothetical protein